MSVRNVTTAGLLLATCLCSSLVQAELKVGDTVVVVRKAPLMVGKEVVHQQSPGVQLTVGEIRGDWVWVNHSRSGWIHLKDAMSLDQAIEHFGGLLRRNPTDAGAHVARGNIWSAKGEWDIAIRDYDAAIKFDSKNASAHGNRARALRQKGDYEKSLSDCLEAIRLDPKNPSHYRSRGMTLRQMGEYEKAIADFTEAIRLDPKYAGAYNCRAWLLATCPDEKFRDAEKAVADATKACELSGWKSAEFLGTLASAYAEEGTFDQAINWQSKAVALAPEKEKTKYQERLDFYRREQPHRDHPKRAIAGRPE